MKVLIYTTPHCPQCLRTKKDFDSLGIDYEVIDLADYEAERAKLRDAGFRTAPVVFAGGQTWSGYDPGKIRALAKSIKG